MLFFNGSVDGGSGDFPVSGIFPPLFYRIIGYLSSNISSSYPVGSSAERDVVEMERQYGGMGESAFRIPVGRDLPVADRLLGSAIRGERMGGWEDGEGVGLESPIGDREPLTAIEKEGYSVWRIGRLTTPGIWRITKDGRIIDEFPVNVDVKESERGVVGEARLSRIFSGNRVRILPAKGGVDTGVDAAEPHVRELWSLCLVAALVMFGLEMVIVYKK
ncbi:MAG: hypothetical protein HY709_04530 [Candidatus Latescibacteria bacterium]|nr:hypothetical protein [Candidatus Latescibacterota bacterium]